MSGVPKIGDNRRVFYPSRYQTRKTLQQNIEVPEDHVAFVRIHYGIDGNRILGRRLVFAKMSSSRSQTKSFHMRVESGACWIS